MERTTSSFERNICRTCLRKISAPNAVSIFSDKPFFQGLTLTQVLKELTQTLVDPKEILPINICLRCSVNLKQAVSFKRCIDKADQTLRFKLRRARMEYHLKKVDSLTSALDAACDELNEIEYDYEISTQKRIISESREISTKAATHNIRRKPVNSKQVKAWQQKIDDIITQKIPNAPSVFTVANKNLKPLKEITPNSNSRHNHLKMPTDSDKNGSKNANQSKIILSKDKSPQVQNQMVVDDRPLLDQHPDVSVDPLPSVYPLAITDVRSVYPAQSNKSINSSKQNDLNIINDIMDSALSDKVNLIEDTENVDISKLIQVVKSEPTVVELSDGEGETCSIVKQMNNSEKRNDNLREMNHNSVAKINSSLEQSNLCKGLCNANKEPWIKNKSNASPEPKTLSCSKCDKKFSNTDFLERHLLYHSLNLEPTNEGANQKSCVGNTEEIRSTSNNTTDKLQGKQEMNLISPPRAIHPSNENLKKAYFTTTNNYDHTYNFVTASAQQGNKPFNTTVEECKYCKKSVYQVLHHAHMIQEHRKAYKKDLKNFRKTYYKCNQCPSAYKDIPLMLTHMTKPHLAKFGCEDCEKVFTGKELLNQHIRKCHAPAKPTTSLCYICGKIVRTAYLSTHVKSHNDTTSIKCPVGSCRILIKYGNSLQDHFKDFHGNAKPFICERCGKQFAHSKNLRRHLLTHVDVRPYKCVICERSFTLQSRLKIHLKLHQHAKPYTCPLCPRTFGHKHSIKKHCIRFHSDDEQNGSPRMPRKCINYNDKTIECRLCHRKFVYEYNLKKHTRTYHPIVYFNMKRLQLNNGSTVEEIIDQEKKYFRKYLN